MNASFQPLDESAVESIDIAIIGTGFAGLGMAIRLKQTGTTNFLVFEQAETVGGTWRDNHYPGCACDVQSHVYSFSYAPNPNWTRMFAPQPEIRAYLENCVERFGIGGFLRMGHGLTQAIYDEAQQRWQLRFSNGKTISARVLISGMGGLSRAAYPNVPGIENFKGKAFHSQNWDHDYPLEHKRVAVIGTGASAIQFVPQIAPRVASLALFQRTPPWIMPKPDRGISALERGLFRLFPATQRFLRSSIYWSLESRVLGFTFTPKIMKLIQKIAVRHIHKQIDDPALREKVTPDYTIGCKRVLISNDYYPALARDNVDVVTTGIARVEEDAVVTTDGVRHEVDALIFGTGFHATDPVPAGALFGRGGRDIAEAWSNGAHAFLGTTLPEFPNFFMIVGPNTGLGHNSMVYMIESQVEYILAALKGMRAAAAHTIEVRGDVEARYNEEIQHRLNRSIWNVGGCKSWYIDPRNGKNTTLWPGFTWRFRQQTSHFNMADYHALRAPAASKSAAHDAVPAV